MTAAENALSPEDQAFLDRQVATWRKEIARLQDLVVHATGQHAAGSSNGRTADFDSANAGSSPAPASTAPRCEEICGFDDVPVERPRDVHYGDVTIIKYPLIERIAARASEPSQEMLERVKNAIRNACGEIGKPWLEQAAEAAIAAMRGA